MNVKPDDLKCILAKNQIDENKQEQIIADLKALIASEKNDEKEKKEYRYIGLTFGG